MIDCLVIALLIGKQAALAILAMGAMVVMTAIPVILLGALMYGLQGGADYRARKRAERDATLHQIERNTRFMSKGRRDSARLPATPRLPRRPRLTTRAFFVNRTDAL